MKYSTNILNWHLWHPPPTLAEKKLGDGTRKSPRTDIAQWRYSHIDKGTDINNRRYKYIYIHIRDRIGGWPAKRGWSDLFGKKTQFFSKKALSAPKNASKPNLFRIFLQLHPLPECISSNRTPWAGTERREHKGHVPPITKLGAQMALCPHSKLDKVSDICKGFWKWNLKASA